MAVFLATWEVEIERMAVQGQLGQKVHDIISCSTYSVGRGLPFQGQYTGGINRGIPELAWP
jgi:hypothetical protein